MSEFRVPQSTLIDSTDRFELLERFKRIAKDPLEFLKAVRTLDEVDRSAPIKHFPWELEYIQWYVRAWQREPKIAVPKSRRMKMSWVNTALILHDTMFGIGRNWAMVSKKEEDSDELVKRAKFIYDNLDTKILPRDLLPKAEYKFCNLTFPELNGRIRGYPSGADQLRQHTLSGIMGDECAFWPNAREMYVGAKPTLEGGGKMVLISSGAPGFFKRLVFDQLEHEKEFDIDALMAGRRKSPMQGVQVWRNPINQFFVFELHYSADPGKRSAEWKKRESSGMPTRDWNREYEIAWDSFSGLPVYNDFNGRVHKSTAVEPHIGLPLLRGWDFGLTPACVVAQLQGRQLVVLQEFTETNMGIERFSDLVLPQCGILFPGYKFLDFIDPAGANRDQTDEGTCALVLDGKGLNCIPGAVAFAARKKAVETLLVGTDKDGPFFLINPLTCSVTTRGLEGGYRYPEGVDEREPNKLRPLKDEHSHPQDALQYIATGILALPKKREQSGIPHMGATYANRR